MKTPRKPYCQTLISAVIALLMLFCVVTPAYAYGPWTHDYIARITVGDLVGEGQKFNWYIFSAAAVTADFMHFDDDSTTGMHNNFNIADFSDYKPSESPYAGGRGPVGFAATMMQNAENGTSDQLSFATSVLCHQVADDFWQKKFLDKGTSLRRGGGEGYKVYFDAYAWLKGHVAVCLPYLDSDLILNTYMNNYNHPEGLPDEWKSGIFVVPFWGGAFSDQQKLNAIAMDITETTLAEDQLFWLTFPIWQLLFLLEPWGPATDTRDAFDALAISASVETEWLALAKDYTFKTYPFEVGENTQGKFEWKYPVTQPPELATKVLTENWTRWKVGDLSVSSSTPKWKAGYSDWSWCEPSNNKSLCINVRTWLYPWSVVNVKGNVYARMPKPEAPKKTVNITQEQDLVESINATRAMSTFAVNDTWLTYDFSKMPANHYGGDYYIEQRQIQLLNEIGALPGNIVQSWNQTGMLELTEEGELKINDSAGLTDLAVSKCSQLESDLLEYYALETRKQAILSGGDSIQPMLYQIHPFGTSVTVTNGEPIVILANDFDYFLAFDLLESLRGHNYNPIRATADTWEQLKNEEKIIVLGDLNDKEIGPIIGQLLNPEELQQLENGGRYVVTTKCDKYTDGQKIFCFVGSNSFTTREAHARYRDLTEKPMTTVISPNGGETWEIGQTALINWNSCGAMGLTYALVFELSRDGNKTWETIIPETISEGSAVWTVTGDVTNLAKIRVTYGPYTDTSDENFKIIPPQPHFVRLPSVTVISPNGGETCVVAGAQLISWKTEGITGNVTIELSRGGDAGWEVISPDTDNDGYEAWKVTGPTTQEANIRVSSGTIHDESDEPFTIVRQRDLYVVPVPKLKVSSPNGPFTADNGTVYGCEDWTVGTTQNITWDFEAITGNVTIELSRFEPAHPGAEYWEVIIPETECDGCANWTVTGSPTTEARVRVSLKSVSSISDTSDEPFIISSLCFIATAAYGTPMAEEIETLRLFRDQYLLTNPVGRALVDVYYRVSPPIAEFITEHPSLKPIVRAGLLPAVAMSTVAVNTAPAEKTAIVTLLVLVSVALAVWAKRRRGRGPEYS